MLRRAQVRIRMENQERDLEILENIYSSQSTVRQRDLAKIVGLSLGMTNAILKRLVQKGLLKISKVNNRNIRYIVSPKGIEAITKRSYRYFRRTVKNVVYYREAIEALAKDIKSRGFDGICLIGESDLDFIVEHACTRYGIYYLLEDAPTGSGTFELYSESYIPDQDFKKKTKDGVAFLQQILM